MTDNTKKPMDVKQDTESRQENSENHASSGENDEAGNDSSNSLESKLQEAEEDAKDNHDRLLRVSAEFENYKKRCSREMEDFRKFANESLVKEMLSVVDNIERAIKSAEEDKTANSSVIEGINMTIAELMKIFEKYGVVPINAVDELFDPAFHQAVAQEEMDDIPENTVLKELQKGYMLHERLLRPAMVVVSAAKGKNKNKKSDK